MTEPIFPDKATQSDDKALAKALGRRWPLYERLWQFLEDEYDPVHKEWKFYMKRSGWTLRILHKKRSMFHLGIRDGYFVIAFIFGKKAQDAVDQSDLPDYIKKTLRDARQYMEGKGLLVDIKLVKDLNLVKNLIRIKMEN